MAKIVFALVSIASSLTLAGEAPSIMPVKGDIVKRYGYSDTGKKIKMNEGIDIKAIPGTTIVSTAAGNVTTISGEKEKAITVDHGNGIETNYKSIAEATAKKGQILKKGDAIGKITKNSILHYEVKVNGVPVDPVTYIIEK